MASGGLSRNHPVQLWYSGGAQLAGMSVIIFGNVSAAAYSRGFYTRLNWPGSAEPVYEIFVSFRDASSVCSSATSAAPIGDRVVVPQAKWNVPLTASAAAAARYTKGACIDHMGTHWAYDFATAPAMSWRAAQMLPLVAMYHPVTAQITAVFFSSYVRQQTLFPPATNGWDVIAITNSLMCRNFCKCVSAGVIGFWRSVWGRATASD